MVGNPGVIFGWSLIANGAIDWLKQLVIPSGLLLFPVLLLGILLLPLLCLLLLSIGDFAVHFAVSSLPACSASLCFQDIHTDALMHAHLPYLFLQASYAHRLWGGQACTSAGAVAVWHCVS